MKKIAMLLIAATFALTLAAQSGESRHSKRVAEPQPQCYRNEPLPPMPPVASPDQVEMIARLLHKTGFDNDRYDIAMLCIHLVGIPVEGLRRMAMEFSFDDNRLKFLKDAYEYCPDRDKYWTLEDCFSFRSNGEELIQYIKRKH